MNLRAKAILLIIILLCIMSAAYFWVPRRIPTDLYDSSIVFDEAIVTKSYYEASEGQGKFIDYKTTNQEEIGEIKSMLYDIKVIPLLFRNYELSGTYYIITFRSSIEQLKVKVYLFGTSYIRSDSKLFRVNNRDAAEKLRTYIENLISM